MLQEFDLRSAWRADVIFTKEINNRRLDEMRITTSLDKYYY